MGEVKTSCFTASSEDGTGTALLRALARFELGAAAAASQARTMHANHPDTNLGWISVSGRESLRSSSPIYITNHVCVRYICTLSGVHT